MVVADVDAVGRKFIEKGPHHRPRPGQAMPALQPFDPIGARYVDAIERLVRFVDETRV